MVGGGRPLLPEIFQQNYLLPSIRRRYLLSIFIGLSAFTLTLCHIVSRIVNTRIVNVNVNEQFLSPRESCNTVTTAAP